MPGQPRFGEVENVVDTSANRVMTRDEIDAFLRRGRNAILATNRLDGPPLVSPVWYHWDGAVFRVSVPNWTAKVASIRRDDRVSLCVDEPTTGTFVTAYGRAELIEDEPGVTEETWPLLLRYFHPPEAQVRWQRYLKLGDRAVIVITPDRWFFRQGIK